MDQYCVSCVLEKHTNRCPSWASPEQEATYLEGIQRIMEEVQSTGSKTAPEASARMQRYRSELFGEPLPDFTQIKHHFNQLLLNLEEDLEAKVREAPDPFTLALQYAQTGNFIDFAAMETVEEEKLFSLLEKAGQVPIQEKERELLLKDLLQARSLLYITDNCGEVVLDKILIREIKRLNPDLTITCLLRGEPCMNDATMEDAEDVGLTKLCHCMGNGTFMNGTILRYLSEKARKALEGADVILAKGQANCETLLGCGLNAYYLFMCKCPHFTRAFQVPLYGGVLARERGRAKG